MYVAQPAGPQVLVKEVYIETKVHPVTGHILVASFRLAGVAFYLLLGRPDHPQAFGIHRPRGIIFRLPDEGRDVEFLWPFHTEAAVIYTKLDQTGAEPPHWADWKH